MTPLAPHFPRTLSVDCGGSGLKAILLSPEGTPLSERERMKTPYPLSPQRFMACLEELFSRLPAADRLSVGFPGMVRNGCVLATPHYVTRSGPFSQVDPALFQAWKNLPLEDLLTNHFSLPTRVVNDAELVALGSSSHTGYEVTITLGTGVGFAALHEGVLLPKLEVSQALFLSSTFDEELGDAARKQKGNLLWNQHTLLALDALRPVFFWDRLVLGGGNAKRLTLPLPPEVTLVENLAGLLGGVRVWSLPTSPRSRAVQTCTTSPDA